MMGGTECDSGNTGLRRGETMSEVAAMLERKIVPGAGEAAQWSQRLFSQRTQSPSMHRILLAIHNFSFRGLCCPLLTSKGTRHACGAQIDNANKTPVRIKESNNEIVL